MTPEMIEKIGRIAVWFVVLLGIGYVLGMFFQISAFLLPGVIAVAAVWYILKSMGNKGIFATIKEIMAEPFKWIKDAAKLFLPGLFK